MPGSLAGALSFDRAGVRPMDGLRSAAGIALPLVVGTAVGHPAEGAQAAVGALPVGIAELTGAFVAPTGLLLATTLGMTLSTFLGSVVAGNDAAFIPTLAGIAFVAGLVVSLGSSATITGIQALLAFVVFGRYPGAVTTAAAHAGWVLAGGLVQTALANLLRTPRPLGPERDAVAAAYDQLTQLARGVLGGASAVPAATALATAGELLARRAAPDGDDDPVGIGELRGLVAEGHRIRLELQALTSLPTSPGAVPVAVDAAAARLQEVAAAVRDRRPPTDPATTLDELAAGAGSAGGGAAATGFQAARMRALLGQVRAAERLATFVAGVRQLPLPRIAGIPGAMTLASGAAENLRQLRLALDPSHRAFRHALRLAVLLPVAEVIAMVLPWQRGYWVALTAMVVLKPDYVATMQRGVARVVGTVGGVVLTGLLVGGLHPRGAGLVALTLVFAWASYTLFSASYAVYTFVLTGLVVCLIAAADPRPLSVVLDRGLDTLVGGALALAGYAVWPTPEAATLRTTQRRLFDALADYARAVLSAYVDPARIKDAGLPAAAGAARRARVDAQASLDRARAEPSRWRPDVEAAEALMDGTRRIVLALHAMRTTLQDATEPVPLPELEPVCAEVATALSSLAAGRAPESDLRARQQDLADLAAGELSAAATPDDERRARRLAVVAAHLDPLVDSINTAAGAVAA
ncbi:MAG TPA: FUSC family protein [Mycobacteriales bacterium]|nr:FUSC family protein [Mycobacteriales bacterium]